MALLDVSGLTTGYQKIQVLHGVSLRIEPGEFVAVIGHNGAGKTTLVHSVMGVVAPRAGAVRYDGPDVAGAAPSANVQRGMALVPQERAVFPNLSVGDNLEVAGMAMRGARVFEQRLEEVRRLFPILKERSRQQAGTMSGGQQRMLSIGIALMLAPRLLMLDEPSLGLAPVLVQQMMERIVEINRSRGTAILLIEQNVRAALQHCSRVYVMKVGRMVYDGPPGPLHDKSTLMKYF
jgi:branched-chain amino acid transport system ATP-binding protein